MPLDNKQANELLDNLKTGYEDKRRNEIERHAEAVAFYGNVHWRTAQGIRSGSDGTTMLRSNYNPDSNQVRVTDNFITPWTQQIEAATSPTGLPVVVEPPEHDGGIGALSLSRRCQRILEMEQKRMRALPAARHANFMSSITGSWLIVLNLRRRRLDADGGMVSMEDWELTWRTLPSTELILDVANPSWDLRDHDEVVVRMVVPLGRAKREYGIDVPEEKASTVGQLCEDYVNASNYTGGTFYNDFARYSKTPAIEMFQVHRRSGMAGDRFDEMYVLADLGGKGERQVVNEDDPYSPFGGDGLPVGVLNYHRRAGSALGQGATQQMIADQKRANLAATYMLRHMAYASSTRWIIDKRTMNPTDFDMMISNGIGRPIFWTGSSSDQGHHPPTEVRGTDPPAIYGEMMRMMPESARQKIHRSQFNAGVGKTHIPDATTQRLLEEADRVPNQIVEEQAKVYADLYAVSLGTIRKAVDVGGATYLNNWQQTGFTARDLVEFRGLDPETLSNFVVRVPRDSVRPRSPFARRNEIVAAASPENAMITKAAARVALCIDADQPLTSSDQHLLALVESKIQDTISGVSTWEPLRYEDHDFVIEVIRRSISTQRSIAPEARQRLYEALERQSQVKFEEMAQQQQALEGAVPAETPQPGGLDLSALLPAGPGQLALPA